MLPLEIIKKYYPKASEEELKEIQEIVYLLASAVMQHFYGSKWMGSFGIQSKSKNNNFKASSIPVRG